MDPGYYGGRGVYEPLKEAFDAAYAGNRAPVPIYIHTTWVEKQPERLEELKRFAGGRLWGWMGAGGCFRTAEGAQGEAHAMVWRCAWVAGPMCLLISPTVPSHPPAPPPPHLPPQTTLLTRATCSG